MGMVDGNNDVEAQHSTHLTHQTSTQQYANNNRDHHVDQYWQHAAPNLRL